MTFDLRKRDFSRERIDVVEIDLDYCTLTHGVAPCAATQTGDAKCVNASEHCNDPANYTPFLSTLTNQTISINSAAKTLTRSAGSFVDDGFEIGDTIKTKGFTNTVNAGPFTITGVSATVITCSAAVMATEAGTGDEFVVATNKPNRQTHRFCTNRSPHPIGLDAIPCLSGAVSVAPAKIDPKGGLGIRSNISASFIDPQGSDIGIDKYLADRTYDPFERGTFFTKLRARNPNYENRPMRHLTGYLVDDVYDPVNFDTHHFILESLDVSNGKASIKGKDVLKLAMPGKFQVPIPNSGKLLANINNVVGTATIDPSSAADEYATSGFLIIDKEVMAFTRSGVTLTITRGQYNTVAVAHNSGATIQQCYQKTDRIDAIVYDLFINYAGIDPSFIDFAEWQSEAASFMTGNLSGIIVKPMDGNKALVELDEAQPHTIYFDDRASKIRLKALQPPPVGATAYNMDSHFIEDSVSTKDDPSMRFNTVFVFYGQFDPTLKIDEFNNFEQTYARIDTESINKYGSNQVKNIFSRWIPTTSAARARRLAALIGRRSANTPRVIDFEFDPKDSDLWIGDTTAINHRDLVDRTGLPVDVPVEIVSAQAFGDKFKYTGIEYLYGPTLPEDEGGADPLTDLIIIDYDDDNVNLYSLFTTEGFTPTAGRLALFVISNGARIGSLSAATAAIITGTAAQWGSQSVKVKLSSGCYIVGKGGDSGQNSPGDTVAAAGENGSDAIEMQVDIELENYGIIGGGGGGGGNAIAAQANIRGYASGNGGAGKLIGFRDNTFYQDLGAIPPINMTTVAAVNGTIENGSIFAGSVTWDDTGDFITGGSSGDLGQAGGAGFISGTFGTSSVGAAGAAGKAIDLNGFTVTYTNAVAGDIRGTVS